MKGNLRLLSGRKLFSPPGNLTRPTKAVVREALINILGDKITNCHWLDLYSGSGIIGCEAIEKGAKTIVAIEKNRKVCKVCHLNLSTISNTSRQKIHIEVINSSVNKFLERGFYYYSLDKNRESIFKNSRFQFVYIDPPYKDNSYFCVLENLLLGDWVSKSSIAICEFSINSPIDIPVSWIELERKKYGDTGIILLNPNQA